MIRLSFSGRHPSHSAFFFFNDTATTEIYTLSLHDALPILPPFRYCLSGSFATNLQRNVDQDRRKHPCADQGQIDRKSTRLNSSHANISYAVFCLKKKKTEMRPKLHTLFLH